MHELTRADFNASNLPAGKHSTKGVGRTQPDPKETVTLPGNILVPLGKGTPTNRPDAQSLEYNEFIVYDIKQILLKYLLKVRFEYQY